MTKPLPSHLQAALGKGHAKDDVPRLVAQLEARGHRVRVIRLQLGNMRREGFGTVREIYRSLELEKVVLDG